MISWVRVDLFLRGNDAVSVQIVILLDSRHYFYLPNSSHLINDTSIIRQNISLE